MSGFTEERNEAIVSACRANVAVIAESLSVCFEQKFEVEIGETLAWRPDETLKGFDAPGLLVTFNVDDQAVLCLIPDSLPLPAWYRHPDDSQQQSRLDTLATQWSLNMLPGDLEVGTFASEAVADLTEEVLRSGPSEATTALELFVRPAPEADSTGEVSSEDEPAAENAADDESDVEATTGLPQSRLLLIWPMSPVLDFEDSSDDFQSPEDETGVDEFSTTSGVGESPAEMKRQRLVRLPVTVIVQLAAKKIELGQLLSLTPGALITFTKSCEDRLDLYVNNQLYCRGEAVKIGEKFGLKISQVGVVELRPSKIL